MTARRGLVDELCFAAEGMAGTAASATLRRLSGLAHAAPSGRLFSAIATLSEMSAKAAHTLEQSHSALQAGDDKTVTMKLARALTHMDDLAAAATGGGAAEEPPAYLKRQC